MKPFVPTSSSTSIQCRGQNAPQIRSITCRSRTPFRSSATHRTENLTSRQKAHFDALVSTKPAGFFQPCDEPLIIQLSRHLARSDEIETQFRKEGLDVESFDQLSRLADRESKQITSLMTRLRLTPQARYRPDSQKLDGTGEDRPKPWEFNAD